MAHRADGLSDIFENDILIRKRTITTTGTIFNAPVNNLDIVNKAYCDGNVPTGATGSFTAASGETITVANGIITFITSATFLILLETGDYILLETGDKIING